MPRLLTPLALVALILCSLSLTPGQEADAITVSPGDWPWWRGPRRNGVAEARPQPPVNWSETENVLWKSPVPGRGHGAPIIVGEQIFLAAAEPAREVQSLLCYARRTGKVVWQTELHRGGFETKGNAKSSLASSTPACDGQRVFINFLHAGAIHTSAVGRDGKILWQKKITDYVLHQGFGSSPAVFGSLVIVSADNKGTGVIAGLDRATGRLVWQQQRPKTPNYASPILLHVVGREQLLLTGCDLVTSLDPLTGAKLWEIPGSTTECVTSTVTDGGLIFTSGGYPKSHVSAVRADGSGQVVWETKTRVYVPSMLAHAGYLYGVQDAGFATCWECATGKEVWKERLGGTFSASPVLVGELIYATNEAGRTFLFKASPAGYERIAENQLGDEVLASPAICGGRIYMRIAVRQEGQRQEMLCCIGTGERP